VKIDLFVRRNPFNLCSLSFSSALLPMYAALFSSARQNDGCSEPLLWPRWQRAKLFRESIYFVVGVSGGRAKASNTEYLTEDYASKHSFWMRMRGMGWDVQVQILLFFINGGVERTINNRYCGVHDVHAC
jgi:hypothetical protein